MTLERSKMSAVVVVGTICAVIATLGLSACHVPMAAKKPRALAVTTWSDATRTRHRDPPPPPPRDSSTYVNADDCERDARAWLDVDKNQAWDRLIGCTTRTDFAYLRRLLRAPWIELVRTKKDAAFVLAKVIAARGANVDDDLQLLRRARVPMFPFASALASPSIYDGKLVLVRGRVLEGRQDKDGAEVHVEETIRVAHLFERRTDDVEDTSGGVSFARDDSDLRRPTEDVRRRERRVQRRRVIYDVEHKSKETGRDLVASMRRADPFLVTGRDFVFLIRFNGSAKRGGRSNDTTDPDTGTGDVVAFYEAALIRVD